MVTSIQKMGPEGETQITSSKLSTSWATRFHRGIGDGVWFPLSGCGRVQEGLKKSTAFPFLPFGERWLGRKGYENMGWPRVHHRGPWERGQGGGLPVQGEEHLQGKQQSWVCLSTPTSGESFVQYMYRAKCMGMSGSKGNKPDGSLLPGSHPAVLPAHFPCLSFWLPLLQHHTQGAGVRREGQAVLGTHTCLLPAVLENAVPEPPWAAIPDSSRWTSFLRPAAERQHAQVRSWTVMPSSTVFASERLCVSNACRTTVVFPSSWSVWRIKSWVM